MNKLIGLLVVLITCNTSYSESLKALYISGGISEGFAKEVINMLEANPNIKDLVIEESLGGLVEEALILM